MLEFNKQSLNGDDGFSDFDDIDKDEIVEEEAVELLDEQTIAPIDDTADETVVTPEVVDKKAGKSKKVKRSKAEAVEDAEKPEMILYLIIDKPVHGILKYIRESGLKVSNMFSNIKEAKDAVLMQTEPTRIVVVDTGTGRFTTPSAMPRRKRSASSTNTSPPPNTIWRP